MPRANVVTFLGSQQVLCKSHYQSLPGTTASTSGKAKCLGTRQSHAVTLELGIQTGTDLLLAEVLCACAPCSSAPREQQLEHAGGAELCTPAADQMPAWQPPQHQQPAGASAS